MIGGAFWSRLKTWPLVLESIPFPSMGIPIGFIARPSKKSPTVIFNFVLVFLNNWPGETVPSSRIHASTLSGSKALITALT